MKNVLEYLEANATLFSDKKAVAYVDDSYSYSELKSLSRRLGATLCSLNLKNQPIAVMADKSVDTLVYFMAVLYSGNYYIPVDPELPSLKMKRIFEDSGATVVLGKENEPKENQEDDNSLKAIGFTGTHYTLADISDLECDLPDTGDFDPAYMVYTSGSTGYPKGVLKSHKAVISFIEAFTSEFKFDSDEVIGNQTPFYFDASAKDIYLMLKIGATLEILPKTVFALPPELISYLNEKKVTTALWVPTVISIVAKLNPFSMVTPTYLRKLFFVGEVMPMKDLNKWIKTLPHIEYVNLYGQSELAGVCCYYKVDRDFENDEVLPIGKNLNNCKIYIVDEDKVVSKDDVSHVGEIYIVSDSLALKYFNDEEKTSQKFIMKDFGEGEVRCFSTGDLASYDKDGNLIFASRSDFQIKHSGYRIELGEIEAVANSLEGISSCCCLYDNKKKKIMLFVELMDGVEMTKKDIQHILRGKLSSYMVPEKVVILDFIPHNANGKIDRQCLKMNYIGD